MILEYEGTIVKKTPVRVSQSPMSHLRTLTPGTRRKKPRRIRSSKWEFPKWLCVWWHDSAGEKRLRGFIYILFFFPYFTYHLHLNILLWYCTHTGRPQTVPLREENGANTNTVTCNFYSDTHVQSANQPRSLLLTNVSKLHRNSWHILLRSDCTIFDRVTIFIRQNGGDTWCAVRN